MSNYQYSTGVKRPR